MTVTFSPVVIEPMSAELVEQGWPAMCFAHQDDDPLSINMSNVNAGVVLRALGFEPGDEGWVGSEAPAEFLARIELARVTEPEDIGVPFHEVPREEEGRGARFFECGRAEGYVQHRFDGLEELASACLAAGKLIGWC